MGWMVLAAWMALVAPARGQDLAPEGSPATAPAEASAPVSSQPRSNALGPAAAFDLVPRVYCLPNGLEVILDPFDARGTVAVSVTYHAGARDQPAGYTGLAHLTEHVMFEGSAHAPGHFLEQLDQLGTLEANGLTSRDATTYYERLPSEGLTRALFLEADRMAFLQPALREERVAVQRAVVLRERVERVDLGGLGMVPGLLSSAVYPPTHPYADLFEHREDIASLRQEHVAWFLGGYYAPGSATLSISGSFDPEEAARSVERFFGPIPPLETRAREVVPRPPVPMTAERRIVVELPLRRDELIVAWPTPAWGEPGDAVLDVVAMMLESELTGRLLVTGQAISVDVRQVSYELASEFMVTVVTDRRAGTQVALEGVDAELVALRGAAPSPTAVAAAQRRLVTDLMARLESPSDRATQLAQRVHAAPGGRWSWSWAVQRWLAVTPEEVRDTVRAWLPADRRLVLSISARRSAPAEGVVVVDMTMGQGPPS